MRSIQMQEICQRRTATVERRYRGRQSERMESQSAVLAVRSKRRKKINGRADGEIEEVTEDDND